MPKQNRPLLVGITGGIGSGKSTICRVFCSLGVPVYDADSRARWLMNYDVGLVERIKKEFGDSSYENGVLNRVYLAKEVFSNPEKLATLNAITHPAVALDFEHWVKEHAHFNYLVKEAALLIESGAYKQLDKLILVSAPEEVRIQRVLKRDSQRSKEQVIDILNRQMPEHLMRKYSDLEILNSGSEHLLLKILKWHSEFLAANTQTLD